MLRPGAKDDFALDGIRVALVGDELHVEVEIPPAVAGAETKAPRAR